MKTWEIWEEGYRVTGAGSTANFKGIVEAETFKEACLKMYAGDRSFNPDNLTYWGCRLFDNEMEARKSFG